MINKKDLFHWQALEFDPYTIDLSFYIWSGLFLIGTIVYALISNSPIMAITFILIGIMGYITLERTPAILNYSITKNGVVVDKEFYDFDNIESFWIIYEEEDRYISFKTTGKLIPFVHIPLGDTDPVTAREILIKYIQEEKHLPTFIDTIGKMLHIR